MLACAAKRALQNVKTAGLSSKTATKPISAQNVNSRLQASFLATTTSQLLKFAQLSKNLSCRSYSANTPVGDEDPIEGGSEIGGDGKRVYSRQEVAVHNSKSDAWIIISSKVYNITSWIEYHPGGETVLLDRLGMDATHAFHDVGHSYRAKSILDSLHIGHVKEKRRYSGL